VRVPPELGDALLAQFAREGGFDGARLQVRRFFAADWSVPEAGSL
jgi:hypothetical protein